MTYHNFLLIKIYRTKYLSLGFLWSWWIKPKLLEQMFLSLKQGQFNFYLNTILFRRTVIIFLKTVPFETKKKSLKNFNKHTHCNNETKEASIESLWINQRYFKINARQVYPPKERCKSFINSATRECRGEWVGGVVGCQEGVGQERGREETMPKKRVWQDLFGYFIFKIICIN